MATSLFFDGVRFYVAGAAPTAPGAPAILSPAPTASQIICSCTAPASDGGSPITGYTWTCVPAAGGTVITRTTGPGVLTTTFSGLAASTQYNLGVQAVNAIGASPVASTTALTQPASTSTILYGPDGTHYPDATPVDTNAPTTVIAVNNWAGLITALQTAAAGDTIHLANGAWSAAGTQYNLAASTHLKTLGQNVLIRAVTPGGVVIDSLYWQLSNTTLMYLEFTNGFSCGGQWSSSTSDSMDRVRIARCKFGPNLQITPNGPATDFHLVECYAPTRGISGSDRLHWGAIPASTTWPTSGHGHFPLTDVYIEASWLEGIAWDGGTGHVDTIQALTIAGVNKLTNTYVGKCGNSSNMEIKPDLQGPQPVGLFWMDTCYVDIPGAVNGLLFDTTNLGYAIKVNNCEINNFRLNPTPPVGATDISGNKFAQGLVSAYPNNTYNATLSKPTFVLPPWGW